MPRVRKTGSFLLLFAFVALCAYALIAPPQQSKAGGCGLGSLLPDGHCRDIITATGAGTLTIPTDWNSASNTVEVISGGGSGAAQNTNSGGNCETDGGGGGYAKKITSA